MTPFESAYSQLNRAQKIAVDHIEGPMLVVAGPGTGKTELLAVRVGNILQKTDTQPYNVLCLTFTDAGAYAMRSRLLQYIGPAAYQVSIYTYHAFCNQVIQENIEYFGGYRDLQAVTDLEKVDIMQSILDELPEDHTLKRLRGDFYADKNRLEHLFEDMKKENWTEADFIAGIADQKERLKSDPEFLYQRKYTDRKNGKVYQVGDLKESKYEKEIEKYERTLAGAALLKVYNEKLKQQERFDFQDMILWVLDAFEKNDELLAKYQERYQYILLDEYQDTNGAQNDLVFQLADYWEKPNLFAVGDDDQSIYRFQGANMNNITDFVQKFNPEVIVLEQNYRSAQAILDAASTLIDYNQERLIHYDKNLQKNLIESRHPRNNPVPGPRIACYALPEHEEVGVLHRIMDLVDQGYAYSDIAVIYRKHREVERMVKFLSVKGVPINIKRKVNVLEIPEIKHLINILHYLYGEIKRPHSEERRLFEIMHYRYFDIYPADIAAVSVYCSRRTDGQSDDLKWRYVIDDDAHLDKLPLRNPEKIRKVGQLVESWISDTFNVTLQVLVEKIVTGSGWLNYILKHEDKSWMLQVFNSFFNLIKEASSRSDSYDLDAFLLDLDKMQDNGIDLPLTQSIIHEEGINFVTAHGSKGLEFRYVFLIKAQKSNWVENNYNQGFKYPYALVPSSAQSDIEDDRRLFYVAMTRAEDGLEISFSKTDEKDKESEAAVFVYETELDVPQAVSRPEEGWIQDYIASCMQNQIRETTLIDKAILNELLQDYKLSATSLNKYLQCPLAFYFENILRVPMARTVYMGFGNAIHYALEFFFRRVNELLPDGPVPEVGLLLNLFEKGMEKYHSHFTDLEYQNYSTHGKQVLEDYYHKYRDNWLKPKAYKLEHVVDDVSYAGIPIKGKLDKLIIYDDHVEVVDYKTGTYKAAKLKPPLGDEDLGGDYWRQIVFYKLLIANDPKHAYTFGSGTMDFVEAQNDNYHRKTLPVADVDERMVRKQLEESYTKIMNHEFAGCGEEDCKWCNFVNEVSDLTAPLAAATHEEEEESLLG